MADELEGKKQVSSYRSIFKANSLFGGIQLYQIVIQVIRSKIVAVLIGTAGMGISGLYSSALSLVQSLTSLGLASSAVRDVSEAHGSGDQSRINLTVSVLRRLVWATGLLGVVSVLVFSPLLSKTSFGDYSHTLAFCVLSVTMLIGQLSTGQSVILQGMRKLKELALVSAIGTTLGLVITAPLYYFWETKGIVPALVLTSFASLVVSWLYTRKLNIEDVKLSFKQVVKEGGLMAKLGIAMTISGVLSTGCSYIIRFVIRDTGGLGEVGLYNAGFVILNTYVGMVFTAIGTDFFPRLAAVNKDNQKCTKLVNEQGEIGMILLCPLLLLCLFFMPLVIRIIYTEEFLPANHYIQWALLGIDLRMFSWVIAYQFVAKAETKLFIVNETVSNVYSLILGIIGYKIGGMSGLGIAFTVSYAIYSLQVYVIARIRYDFQLTGAFARICMVTCTIMVIALFINFYLSGLVRAILGGTVILIGALFAIIEMNKRMDIIGVIRRKVKS